MCGSVSGKLGIADADADEDKATGAIEGEDIVGIL